MQKKYNFFVRLKDSIAGPVKIATYAIEDMRAKGVSYLVLICLISAVLTIVTGLAALYPMGRLQLITDQIPKLDLRNGVMTMDISEPVVIDTAYSAVIIENGNSFESLGQYRGYGQIIYINSAGFYMLNNGQEFADYWSSLGTLNFNTQQIVDAVFSWTWVILLLVLPILFVIRLIGSLIFALVCALIGLLLNLIFGMKVPFGGLFKLSIYAMTTQALLNMVLDTLRNFVPMFTFYMPVFGSYVITVGFMVLYFLLYKKSKQNDGEGPQQPQPQQ